ncbi:MAG: SRPBCC family protein [Rhodobacteraceae bacterium]|nr:MAG: SRPBCC family protein [Paracoccaceae bacterium]
MQFQAKEDIEAPIDKVFAILSDVNAMERQALRRGIKVRRITTEDGPEAGMRWNAGFKFRGRDMLADVLLCRFEPPEALAFEGQSGGLDTTFEVDLTALSPGRTRMSVTTALLPRTLSARLLVQSLKLAKGRVTRKFSVRVAQFAKTVEERARKET